MNQLSLGNTVYSFRDVFEVLASARSFEEVLDVILATALRELQAEQGSLLLLQNDGDSDGEHLQMLASIGLPGEISRRGYVPRKGSISEYVLRERRPLVLNDTPRTSNYQSFADDTSTPRTIRSALCVPLIARGKVIGTMNLNRMGGTDRQQFADDDMEVCSILAGQAAIVIENRRLHDELLRTERLAAVGQTVASISHCIKNILAGVNGGLGITQMGLEANDVELMRQGFELLKRNSGTLGNLVLDLLDYAKEREPLRDTFDLCNVLSHVVETLEFKAESLGVKIGFTARERDIQFYGDADQLLRAVINLATNAIEAAGERHTDGTGTVELSLARLEPGAGELSIAQSESAREWIEIRVEDNGPGIPEHARLKIWDLFYSTKGSRGTGIGLATTRKMIEEHNGIIRVHSVVDQGTLFQILLPNQSLP